MCDVIFTAVYATRDTNMYSIILRGRGILLICICSHSLTHCAPVLCMKVSVILLLLIDSHLPMEGELICFALYNSTWLIRRCLRLVLGINAMIIAEPIRFTATAQIDLKRGEDSRTGLCQSILLWCLGSGRYRLLWGIPWTRNRCCYYEVMDACACGWAYSYRRGGRRRSGSHGNLVFLTWRYCEMAKPTFGRPSCLLFAKQHRGRHLLDRLAQSS